MEMMLFSWSVMNPLAVITCAALGGDHLGGDFWGEKSESVFQLCTLGSKLIRAHLPLLFCLGQT